LSIFLKTDGSVEGLSYRNGHPLFRQIWYILVNKVVLIADILLLMGYAVVQLVEVLRYKPEGRGFNSQWCHWNFSLT
jgi:hypothetical protein